MSEDQQNLNTEEKHALVGLLKKLQPGFLPYEIFVEMARIMALPVVEMVPLRLNTSGKVEVLLLPRDPDDDIWPGQVHTPGTVIRATDESGDVFQPFRRIDHDELGSIRISKPHYVGSLLHKSRRGVEQAQIFWVEVRDDPVKGGFYEIDQLPPNLVSSQTKFIAEAARNYLAYKQTEEQ